MIKKVGVLLVHGLGTVADDFAHDTVQELREKVSGRGLRQEDIAWETVYWAPVLSGRENRLWTDLSADNDLNWAKLRKFFINAFGSSTAYHATHGREGGFYQQMHDLVHDSLKKLRAQLGGADAPLVVIAHSLGSEIISDYIWDRQSGKETERYGATPFERMETLAGLVTLGSGIPLSTVSCKEAASIKFPPPELDQKLARRAKWLNFYDSDDVLGWPLKPLSDSYAQAVTEDIEVSVGNILNSWNPAHHLGYWTDAGVMKPVGYLLASILEASGGTGS